MYSRGYRQFKVRSTYLLIHEQPMISMAMRMPRIVFGTQEPSCNQLSPSLLPLRQQYRCPLITQSAYVSLLHLTTCDTVNCVRLNIALHFVSDCVIPAIEKFRVYLS